MHFQLIKIEKNFFRKWQKIAQVCNDEFHGII